MTIMVITESLQENGERWELTLHLSAKHLQRTIHSGRLSGKRDISVFIIFPVFQNPELLKQDSSMFAITSKGLKAKDDWVEFVCPSRVTYRKTKVDELSGIIRSLDPDGISIDFIRQFVFWEMIWPDRDPETIDRACYCDSCLAGFTAQIGVAISRFM